jgi:uncharacterized membrane protein YqjE
MTAIHNEPLGDQLRRGVDEAKAVRGDLSDIYADVMTLASKEMELARVEMAEQAAAARNAAMFGAAAAVFALLMLAFAATTVMFALDEVMDLWLAALITAAGLLVITALLGLMARQQVKQITVAPKKTMESVREDVRWARDRMNFAAK